MEAKSHQYPRQEMGIRTDRPILMERHHINMTKCQLLAFLLFHNEYVHIVPQYQNMQSNVSQRRATLGLIPSYNLPVFNQGLYAILSICPQQLPLIKPCAEPFLWFALVYSSSHNTFVEARVKTACLTLPCLSKQAGERRK